MNITFVTYTHTDYSDIWPLTFDGIEKLKDLYIEKVFACDKYSEDSRITNLYDRTILYDDSLTYPQRVAQVLEQISSDYVFFVHDIDIILNFNISAFYRLFDLVKEYNLDRMFLGMLKPSNETIEDGRFVLTRSRDNSPIYVQPYDVGPSIWKREVFLTMMYKHKDETYRSIESCDIQKDLDPYRCFGIAPSQYYIPYFQIARPVSSDFKFLHILSYGKWFDLYSYMDLQIDLLDLLNKYKIDVNKRGIGSGRHLFSVSRSLEKVAEH